MAEDNDKSKMKSLGWELAQKVFLPSQEGGMTASDLDDCFGTPIANEVFRMDFADALKKYKAWEVNQKLFHVGDEVKSKWDNKLFAVTRVGVQIISVVDKDGYCGTYDKNNFVKTGRTYPHIVRALAGLREGGCASSASCSAKDAIGEIERG